MKKRSYFKNAVLLASLAAPGYFEGEYEKTYNRLLFPSSLFSHNFFGIKEYAGEQPFLKRYKFFLQTTDHFVLPKSTAVDLQNSGIALSLHTADWSVTDIPTVNVAMIRENFHLHQFNFFNYEAILNYYRIKRIEKPGKPNTKMMFRRKLYRYVN